MQSQIGQPQIDSCYRIYPRYDPLHIYLSGNLPTSEDPRSALMLGVTMTSDMWSNWQELNFATSSGTATEAFRSQENCGGYTGEGEEFPTGVSCSGWHRNYM